MGAPLEVVGGSNAPSVRSTTPMHWLRRGECTEWRHCYDVSSCRIKPAYEAQRDFYYYIESLRQVSRGKSRQSAKIPPTYGTLKSTRCLRSVRFRCSSLSIECVVCWTCERWLAPTGEATLQALPQQENSRLLAGYLCNT